jgi:hypothetical protein
MEFIRGRVWVAKSLSKEVSANKVVASGWTVGSVVVSAAGRRRCVMEGILTGVTAKRR